MIDSKYLPAIVDEITYPIPMPVTKPVTPSIPVKAFLINDEFLLCDEAGKITSPRF